MVMVIIWLLIRLPPGVEGYSHIIELFFLVMSINALQFLIMHWCSTNFFLSCIVHCLLDILYVMEIIIFWLFTRDQYQSACLYIRHSFALYVVTWLLEKKMVMSFEGMLMCEKFTEKHYLVQLLVLEWQKQSLIMSK